MASNIDVQVYNRTDELVKVVAAVLIDPSTGLPTTPSGGGSSGSILDFELLLIQDSEGTQGIRRETNNNGTITVTYETLDGSTWSPVQPVSLLSPALPPNASTASNQTALQALVGTAADSATTATVLGRLLAVLNALKMPTYSSVTGVSIATSTTGANFVTFGSQACESLDLVNDTGVAIEYRRNGTGVTITIPAGSARMIVGISNANEIGVRRVDQVSTAVTVKGEAIKV